MGSILAKLELDARLLGMLGVLALIWIGFDVVSDGVFLTPRNLWNLSVQTASVATMSTGMVLVIVTRNIDLSVGSVLGVVGMIIGVAQTQFLPHVMGGFDQPGTWIIAVALAMVAGALIGALQGYVIAYLGVWSFIVTLGGLLIWRGAAWWVTQGQTVAPMDSRFQMIGGGVEGSIGAGASWVVGIVAVVAAIAVLVAGRRKKISYGFAVRPLWAEVAVSAVIAAAIIGCVLVVNAYPLPIGVARRVLEAKGLPWPEGGVFISHGFAIPLLIAVGVGIVITFITGRTRFGRYVFAIGGNPEAAELSGINTRRTLVMVFALMGLLTGIAACISTARLNAATNATGTTDELYVIAATVIGGTSLSGGAGTIYGAMLGAVVMASLQSGMVLLGVDAPLQSIVVGLVLVVAVGVDNAYRRHVR